MASLIKTDRDRGSEASAQVPAAAEGQLVHEVLATPVQGVVNVDHSLEQAGVRMRMVERVRELIAMGFYDRPEFLDMLAEKVRREF